jgi:rhodanese-related sulfurtransferase
MRKLIFLFMVPVIACAQVRYEHPACENKAFDKMLESLLQFSVPTISCKALHENRSHYYVLDARERHEYDVSHIVSARYVGYEKFDYNLVKDIPKDAAIVVYCSVGYRSEKIGEKLQTAGFKNVKNLYGSLFEWMNEGFPVVNNYEMKTQKVHAYNRAWGIWLTGAEVKKVY